MHNILLYILLCNAANSSFTKISGSNIYTDGGFKKFTVRVFFQWYEGDGETMNNEQDTQAGIDAANNSTKFTINANINFEQII